MLNYLWSKTRQAAGAVYDAGKKAVVAVAEKVNAGIAVVTGAGIAAASSLTGTASAADTITLPDMPIDFGSLATSSMTTVGTVLVAIAGIVVVIALCLMGLRKLSSAFNGRA